MSNNMEIIEKIKSIDWEFSEADTQYLTHNIHRYSGKFIPQIANKVIEFLTEPGDIVLDPYLGSGTTALEAMLMGRKSIGVDLNPLAILISEVKTSVIGIQILSDFRSKLISTIESAISGQTSIFNSYSNCINPETSDRFSSEWNKKWYQEHVLNELIIIYDIIEKIENT